MALFPGTRIRIEARAQRTPAGQYRALWRIARLDRITVVHDGWNTLRKRLAKVDLYHTLDPDGQYNCGVPYDEGLLFGYKAHLMGLAAYPLVERSQSHDYATAIIDTLIDNAHQRRRGTCAMSGLKLVCLLPVRNGEADLPGYLEAVEGLADAVIALDDGSTDGTRQILDASPLVKLVLENPPRADYAGWDDAANRNRLLEAAALLEPDWVLSLDADERIPPADAAALRAFIETDALPGLAYGFKVYRMWQDLEHYDQAGLWVYRLFAFKPGSGFPTSGCTLCRSRRISRVRAGSAPPFVFSIWPG